MPCMQLMYWAFTTLTLRNTRSLNSFLRVIFLKFSHLLAALQCGFYYKCLFLCLKQVITVMSTLRRPASSSCSCTFKHSCYCKLSSTASEGSPCANWMSTRTFPTNPKLQRINQQTSLQRFLHGVGIHCDCTLSPRNGVVQMDLL